MRALCGRLDAGDVAEVFFGRENAKGVERHWPSVVEEARTLCAQCPIRQQCLDEALATPERFDAYGIRGGLLPKERRALRMRWQIVVRSTGEEWRGGPSGRDTGVRER